MNKRTVIPVMGMCAMLALSACAQTEDKMDADIAKAVPEKTKEQIMFDQAYSEAEAARKKAASVGGEWRDTKKIMKKAEDAAAKGDYATAIKLSETARTQGELGYIQAMDEKDAGNPSYLK
jgi:hypothetical protein